MCSNHAGKIQSVQPLFWKIVWCIFVRGKGLSSTLPYSVDSQIECLYHENQSVLLHFPDIYSVILPVALKWNGRCDTSFHAKGAITWSNLGSVPWLVYRKWLMSHCYCVTLSCSSLFCRKLYSLNDCNWVDFTISLLMESEGFQLSDCLLDFVESRVLNMPSYFCFVIIRLSRVIYTQVSWPPKYLESSHYLVF